MKVYEIATKQKIQIFQCTNHHTRHPYVSNATLFSTPSTREEMDTTKMNILLGFGIILGPLEPLSSNTLPIVIPYGKRLATIQYPEAF